METFSFPTELDIINKLKDNPKLLFIMNFSFFLLSIFTLIGIVNIIYNINQIRKRRINPIPPQNNVIALNFSHFIPIIIFYFFCLLLLQLLVRLFYKFQSINLPEELPYSSLVVIDLIVKILTTIFIIYIIKKVTRHPLKEIGLSRYNFLTHIKYGILTIVTLIPILRIINFINSEILRLREVPLIAKFTFSSTNINTQIIIIVSILIIAPIAEEIFFRYLLNGCLKKEFGTWLSIFLGGMIFAAFHFHSSSFLPLAVLGIGLSYIYELKRSITIVIVAHSLFNLSSLYMLYIIKLLFQN